MNFLKSLFFLVPALVALETKATAGWQIHENSPPPVVGSSNPANSREVYYYSVTGGSGYLSITVSAPSAPGNYSVFIQPVVASYSWSADFIPSENEVGGQARLQGLLRGNGMVHSEFEASFSADASTAQTCFPLHPPIVVQTHIDGSTGTNFSLTGSVQVGINSGQPTALVTVNLGPTQGSNVLDRVVPPSFHPISTEWVRTDNVLLTRDSQVTGSASAGTATWEVGYARVIVSTMAQGTPILRSLSGSGGVIRTVPTPSPSGGAGVPTGSPSGGTPPIPPSTPPQAVPGGNPQRSSTPNPSTGGGGGGGGGTG